MEQINLNIHDSIASDDHHHTHPPSPSQQQTQTQLRPQTETMELQKVQQKSVEAAKDILFGSIAGIAGKFIEYPFDTVKVRLQSQPTQPSLRLYTGPIDCFRQSLRHDGIRSLYRGISAPLIGASVENSSLFFSYAIAQDFTKKYIYNFSHDSPTNAELPLIAMLSCGAASGAFTSLLLTPIELIKCKMQIPVAPGHPKPGPAALIATVFRHHGISGFWHGQMGTLIRETGGSAAWFGSHEIVTRYFRSRLASQRHVASVSAEEIPFYQQLLAGATAGVAYNFLFYPADTIKSRMQTASSSAAQVQKTFWNVGRMIWKVQGVKGLYAGCGITCARSAPSSAFIFAIYEGLKARFPAEKGEVV